MSPLVSVIIPTYNRSTELQTAVGSVLSQTFRDFELIVVDDQSKTPAQNVLENIRDKRLTILRHGVNQGVSAARNTGIARAKGEWIAFLDDDDTWSQHRLHRQLDFMYGSMKKTDGSVTEFLDLSSQTIHRTSLSVSQRGMDYIIVTGTEIGSGSTMLVKRDVFDRVGGYDRKIVCGQDWEWLLRFREQYKMTVVPEALTFYSGSHVATSPFRKQSIEFIAEKHRPRLRRDFPHLVGPFEASIQFKLAATLFKSGDKIGTAFSLLKASLVAPYEMLKLVSVTFSSRENTGPQRDENIRKTKYQLAPTQL